ncbi:uncharacterized protein AAES06_005361 [Glossophaga mutica]
MEPPGPATAPQRHQTGGKLTEIQGRTVNEDSASSAHGSCSKAEWPCQLVLSGLALQNGRTSLRFILATWKRVFLRAQGGVQGQPPVCGRKRSTRSGCPRGALGEAGSSGPESSGRPVGGRSRTCRL